MTATSKIIAGICGVSQGTVDRALHNRSGISEETKNHILKVADELGYRPHLLAKGLQSGETKTIGIIVFDLAHSFFTQLVTELILNLKKQEFFTYVSITNKDSTSEWECLSHLVDLHVDGIILCPINKGPDYVKRLELLDIPIVTVGNSLEHQSFPFVGIHDQVAIIDMVRLIHSRGYRKIIYVSPPESGNKTINDYGLSTRLNGFRLAMEMFYRDQSPTIIRGKDYLNQIEGYLPTILTSEKTVLLCHNDHYAIRVMELLHHKGIKIPDQVGLMGFDNIDTLQYIKPRLTTVDYHIDKIGEIVVDKILEQIARKREKSFTNCHDAFIEHSIIDGESI